MELNKAACEAATGAFTERLAGKPTTGDLLAALRFALEAYESVRVAPAPADMPVIKTWRERLLEESPSVGNWPDGALDELGLYHAHAEIADLRAELDRLCRAQRTTEGK